jgi:carbon storage regulator
MLVVRRRAGEAIVLAGEIEIEVIEISRTRVKLGIRAPRTVTVLRRESIVLAQQNHSAAALLASPPETVDDLLRLLGNVGAKTAQTSSLAADM